MILLALHLSYCSVEARLEAKKERLIEVISEFVVCTISIQSCLHRAIAQVEGNILAFNRASTEK